MRKGFTLIELLVVIAMLMILMGSVSSAPMSARRRAKIAKATAACHEMTNAILAYENYAKNYTLEGKETGGGWREAEEGFLGFMLGKGSLQHGAGGKIPVLYNGEVSRGKLLDPWGRPYYVKIMKCDGNIEDRVVRGGLSTAVGFPNYNRIRAWEVAQ